MKFKNLTGIQQFDFQINRILTYGAQACNEDEVYSIKDDIQDLQSWFTSWMNLGIKAELEGRFLHSAYYFRLAEFFLSEKDDDKESTYQRCIENFDKIIIKDENVKKEFVSYENSEMKTFIFTPEHKNIKETIVMFGGYDSFIEEFYLTMKEFSEQGYKIILFEGPGQGLTLKTGLKFEYKWELPVSAILDHYNLDNISVIGISWGGYFALRAAAFDKRIKNVVAYDILYDGFDCMLNPFPNVLKQTIKILFVLKQEKLINKLMFKLMDSKIIIDWAITHGMYITGEINPYRFYKSLKKHTLRGLMRKISCNTLLLAGEKDHYIPKSHFYKLMKGLTNAKSLEGKMFTVEEGGEQHCQVGNHKLAIEHIIQWLDKQA